MGKKNKKSRKSRKNREAGTLLPQVQQKLAREAFSGKKYQQAIDGFKDFCKKTNTDQKEYLPEFIECYQGLADQLMEKGEFSKAKAALENIKVLTGKEAGRETGLVIAFKTKDFHKAAKISIDLLCQKEGQGSPHGDQGFSESSRGRGDALISNGGRLSFMADALVLSFEDLPELNTTHPVIYKDLRAVQTSIKEICEENYEAALNQVRDIGKSSLFSDWKMFIKGLIAFYSLQDKKALKAFTYLSTRNRLKDLAEPYLILLNNVFQSDKKVGEDLSRKTLEAAGRPELAPLLPRADYLWNVGRYRDSYKHICLGLSSFPSGKIGIAGILTQFFFNSAFDLPEKSVADYLKGLFLINAGSKESFEKRLAEILILRVNCLLMENSLDDSDRIGIWEDFLKCHGQMYPDSHKVQVHVNARLGKYFAQEMPEASLLFSWGSGRKKGRLRNGDLAERFFKKNISLDKDDKDAYLNLLMVYEKSRKKKEANKLLDKLVIIFPRDKTILAKTGNKCVERNAAIKGMKCLEQACRLDPLDSAIKDDLSRAYLQVIINYYGNGKVQEARQIFEEAIHNGADSPENFVRGVAYLYAFWSIFEFVQQNDDFAKAKAKSALEKAGSPLGIQYFSLLICFSLRITDGFVKKLKDDVDAELGTLCDPGSVVTLLKIYFYIRSFGEKGLLADEGIRLARCAKKSMSGPCSRDNAGFIISFLADEIRDFKLADQYLNKMLKEDNEDPLFLYLRWKTKKGGDYLLPKKGDVKTLKDILLLAKKRNDGEMIQALQKEIKGIDQFNDLDLPPVLPMDFPGFEDDDVLDEGFDDDGCYCPKCRKNRAKGRPSDPGELREIEGLFEKILLQGTGNRKRRRR